MSIKVYYAYRTPKKNWIATVDRLRAEAKRIAQDLLKDKILLIQSNEKAVAQIAGDLGTGRSTTTIFEIDSWLQQQFKNQINSSRRNSYDFSASAALRFHGNWVYLIPYNGDGMYKLWDFLKKDPEAWGWQEYGYWNNTDQPDEVSPQEWGRRRKIWRHLTEDAIWRNFLVMEVLNVENWIYVSPMWDMLPNPDDDDELDETPEAPTQSPG